MKQNLHLYFQFFILFSFQFLALPPLWSQSCPLTVAGVPDFYTFSLDVTGEYSAALCVAEYGAIINIDGVVYNQTNCFDPGDGWVAVYSKTVGIGAGASLPFTANFVFGSCEYDIGGVLPVELARFSGQSNGNTVELKWTTWAEWNNEGFEVQRLEESSEDTSMYWASLGFVPGAGHSSIATDYAFTDKYPVEGRSYYRLKQLDFDGAYSYSGIIMIDHQSFEAAQAVGLFPNPTSSSVRVHFARGETPELRPYTLYDVMGRPTQRGYFSASGMINLQHLPAGTYYLNIAVKKQQQFIRLVKQ